MGVGAGVLVAGGAAASRRRRVRRPAPQVSTVAAAALAAQIERSLYDPFPGVDLTKPLTPLFERLSRS